MYFTVRQVKSIVHSLPAQTFHWLFISLKMKAEDVRVDSRTMNPLAPTAPPTASSTTLLLAHSVPIDMFLKHTMMSLGPLHWLFSDENTLPRTASWLTLSPPLCFDQTTPSERPSPITLCQITPTPTPRKHSLPSALNSSSFFQHCTYY